MKTAEWKVLDPGLVSLPTAERVSFSCPGCGREADLPIKGVALAQIHDGIVFDAEEGAMPNKIQCRFCRRRFEMEA